MNSCCIPIFAALLVVALAGYGEHSPANYPGGHIWYPRHGPRPDYRSNSRSDSEEHKCRTCHNLKIYKMGTDIPTASPNFTYFEDRNGCRNAIISCPMDNEKYFMAVIDENDGIHHISSGTHIERVVKCNKKGKYESTILQSSGKVTFSKVTCLKEVAPPA